MNVMLFQGYRVNFLALLLPILIVGCKLPSSDLEATNKEVVRKFFAAIDAQDYEALNELMDEAYIIPTRDIDGPARAVGREAAFGVFRGVYGSFPDYTHDIEEIIAEGNRVAVRVVLRGTHLGQYSGVAPTGIEFKYAGTYMATVIDGVLTEVWSLDDEIELFRQLGMELTSSSDGN